MQIAIADAKAHFAELIRRAEAGEPVVITRHGRPVAELRAAAQPADGGLVGALRGRLSLPEDMTEGDADIARLFAEGAGDAATAQGGDGR